MSRESEYMTAVDELGREIRFRSRPMRLASLCPSLTETLFELGAGDRVVARTSYCVHPADGVRGVRSVGGVKDFDAGALPSCKPDLVIASKEENPRELIEELATACPVYVFDVVDFEGGVRAVETLGRLVGLETEALRMAGAIRAGFEALRAAGRRRVAYLIWREPYIGVGAETFIHSMLGKCGLEHVRLEGGGRYPETTIEELRAAAPELALLGSEPYEFNEGHVEEIAEQLPGVRVMLVDGEMFAWYGARMVKAAEYFRGLIG